MKQYLLLLLILTACMQIAPTKNQTIPTSPVVSNVSVPTINVTPHITNTSKLYNSAKAPTKQIITKVINGTTHVIEVVDVTEDGKGCLINVDGITSIIDKDMTQRINGVRIHVLNVVLLHSQLENTDLCQLLIG